MKPKYILNCALLLSIIISIVAVICVSIALKHFWEPSKENFTVDQLKVFIDAYKTIGVGFLVAILATILPQVLPAAKYEFEHFKESREAYSEAKTAIIYLPAVIVKLPYLEAIDKIEMAHVSLHLAQSYDELKIHLRDEHPKSWGTRMFWKLTALHVAVTENSEEWDNMEAKNGLKLLNRLLDEVNKDLDNRVSKEQTEEQELDKKLKEKLKLIAVSK